MSIRDRIAAKAVDTELRVLEAEIDGEKLRFKQFTAKQKCEIDGLAFDESGSWSGKKYAETRFKQVIYSMVNEDGTAVFTKDDEPMLRKLPSEYFDKLYANVLAVNRSASVDKLEKNSETVPT